MRNFAARHAAAQQAAKRVRETAQLHLLAQGSRTTPIFEKLAKSPILMLNRFPGVAQKKDRCGCKPIQLREPKHAGWRARDAVGRGGILHNLMTLNAVGCANILIEHA